MNRSLLKHQWDRALAIATAIAGIVLLVIGWWNVSDTALVAEQIPFLASQCVGGLICFGVATTLWISADLRDEWAKLDGVHRSLGNHDEVPSAAAPAPAPVQLVPTNGSAQHRRALPVETSLAR